MKKQGFICSLLLALLVVQACKLKTESDRSQEFKKILEESIQEFEERTIHNVLTPIIIKKTPDSDLIQAVFDNIETNFEDGEAYSLAKIKSLTPGQQAIFSIWWLRAELYNGGFNQFYSNPSGKFAKMAEEGLNLIQAQSYAQLVKKANSTHLEMQKKGEISPTNSAETFSKSNSNNPLNKYDELFYELDKTIDLDSIQIRYIREHVEEFVR